MIVAIFSWSPLAGDKISFSLALVTSLVVGVSSAAWSSGVCEERGIELFREAFKHKYSKALSERSCELVGFWLHFFATAAAIVISWRAAFLMYHSEFPVLAKVLNSRQQTPEYFIWIVFCFPWVGLLIIHAVYTFGGEDETITEWAYADRVWAMIWESKFDDSSTRRIDFMKKAALQGVSRAQFDIGAALENGHDIEQNIDKAVKWYEKAATQDVIEARLALSRIYLNEKSGCYRPTKAMFHFQRAAAKGNVEAFFGLSQLYAEGRVVPQDFIQAHSWANLAASQAATKDFERFVEWRNLLAARMAPDGIAEAHRLAQKWKAK